MNRWTVLFAAIMFSSFVAIGCSGGGGGSPVVPSANPEITSGSDNSGQIQHPNTSLLGYFDVYLDVGNQTMEVVEDRTASYTINIVPFLNQMASPPNGISLGAIDFDDSDPSNLIVDVEFKWYHPFPTIEQYKVYDFMGVIISNGDSTLGYHNLSVGNYGSDTYMTNADGYTRWFNPTEFTTELIFGWAPGGIQNLKGSAKLNPFKAYGRGLGANSSLWDWLEGGSNNDGVFMPGDGRTMSLEFPMPSDGLVFGYAAVCCWEEQGTGPYTPYHRAEPIAFRVTVEDNVWYDGTDSGGNLIADIDVWAWGDQPNTVQVESTVLSALEPAAPTGGGGANWSTYEIDVPSDVNLNSNDGHDMWVIAECDGHNYINIDGVPAPPSSQTLAAFYRVPLFIATEPYNACPIIDSGVNGNATPSKVAIETYSVVAHDLDPLDTLTYAWTVTDNSTGLPVPGYIGAPGYGGGYLDVNWGSIGVSIGDSFDIDCDVNDGKCTTGATTLLVIIVNADPICELEILSPTMPYDGWAVMVDFDASGSTDPDGDPLTFSWDFDDDGTFGDPYEAGTDDNPQKLYDSDYVGQACVMVEDGIGGETICCVDLDITAYKAKNIELRSGPQGRDIALVRTNGDLYILYSDGQVWKYTEANYYQTGSYHYYSNTVACFMDASANGDSIVSGPKSGGGSYCRSFYASGGAAANHTAFKGPDWSSIVWCPTGGTEINKHCSYYDCSYGGYDSIVWRWQPPTYGGAGGNLMYEGTGISNIHHDYLVGCEADTNSYVYCLEKAPEYRVERRSNYFSTQNGPWWGGFGDTSPNFNDPRDITRDTGNTIYVLDELSTGDPAIKKFSSTGTTQGTYGDTTNISSTPLRIEGTERLFGGSGDNLMFVLHGNTTDGYFLSVFFPGELSI